MARAIIAAGTIVVPPAAPVLSNPNAGTPTSSGTTNAQVTTDTGSGTLYWAVVTNGGSATNAQIKAGAGGNIVAGVAGNQAVSASGVQTVATITGLSASTTYQILFLQNAVTGDSNQSSVSLTTLSAGDANWANVVLLAFNDNAADGTTTFADQSGSAHTINKSGSGTLKYSNTTSPTGMTTSVSFPGASTYLYSANSADWQLGSGDFTIEAFIYTAVGQQATMVSTMPNTATVDEFLVMTGTSAGADQVYASHNTTAWDISLSALAVPSNTWVHKGFVRSGSSFYRLDNGTLTSAGTYASALLATAQQLSIGAAQNGFWFSGNMCSLRITKGVARYTTNYTPPSLPLPNHA